MNASFEKNNAFNSNNRIFEGYFVESARPVDLPRRLTDGCFAVARRLSELTRQSALLRVLRVSGVAASLIGFVGVIGAMERGTLSLGAGLLVGALLVGIEYLCLKKQ
ncbi:MAG: hypothetical protein IJX62_05125 [Clostridia bacterium]|nr:hypothetical protein [Clostridia bacterium]